MTHRGLTVQELEDIINDPKFYKDLESADVVVLPPENDYLTDEDEADDEIIGIAEVNDVPGEIELQYTTSGDYISDNEEGPSTSYKAHCRGKKRKLYKILDHL